MKRNSGKQDAKETRELNESKDKLDRELAELYRLPLADFTAARNALAARLKQDGRRNEADFVKTLAKPSVSAWAVNQLYWTDRAAFEQLIAAGERVRQAQTPRKTADMRGALEARRETLAEVSELATALLQNAGHNPTQDTMRRVATTLEAVSVYASVPDGPRPGRLTHDLDPPGFESFASMMPVSGRKEVTRVAQPQVSDRASTSTRRKADAAPDTRQLEKARQARIAAAKVSVQEAKSLLVEARAKAQGAEATQKKAVAAVKEAEKQKRDAEERLERAQAASEAAAQHAQNVVAEVKQAAKAVDQAKDEVAKASKELERLFREGI